LYIVPPDVTNGNTALAFKFTYNKRSQLIKKFTPDAGESEYWYDDRGLQVAFQDANMKAMTPSKYLITEYDNYGWNWGVSHPGLSLLGCIWSHRDFDDIYDVPLDGSHIFYVYDSGDRGCGSRSRITAKLAEKETVVPFVNPGALIPITAN
jgi:hypothetical protein